MQNELDILYEKVLPVLLKNISDDKKEFVKKGYKKYITKSYTNIKDINKVTNRELSIWQSKNHMIIEEMFVYDEALEYINCLRNYAYELAVQKIETGYVADESIVGGKKKKLDDYLNRVLDFNKQRANFLTIDAKMDFDFALGKSDISSIRVGAYRK